MAAALRSVCVQQDEQAVLQQWDQVITMLSEKLPAAAALMQQAIEDMLVLRSYPSDNFRKIWRTKQLERINKKSKRHSRIGDIFTKGASSGRLVGALLLEPQE